MSTEPTSSRTTSKVARIPAQKPLLEQRQQTTKSRTPNPTREKLLNCIRTKSSDILRRKPPRQRKMHAALQLPDILYTIFRDHVTKKTLMNCALVCRLWGVWATDVLWRTYPVPLSRILRPLNPVETRAAEDKDSKLTIRTTTPEAWRSFLQLSNKVGKIFVDFALTDASLEWIELAKKSFGGEALFSQLRSVTMRKHMPDNHTVKLLTVPTLTDFTICCFYLEADAHDWIFNTVPTIAPNLTFLVIVFGRPEIFPLDASRFTALTYLQLVLFDPTPRLWESLGKCVHLEKLVLTMGDNVHENPGNPFIGVWSEELVHFPALKAFKARIGNPRVVLKLVPRSRMPMLECLLWGRWTPSREDEATARVIAHLKQYSPKLDIDRMFADSQSLERVGWYDDEDDCRS